MEDKNKLNKIDIYLIIAGSVVGIALATTEWLVLFGNPTAEQVDLQKCILGGGVLGGISEFILSTIIKATDKKEVKDDGKKV